MITNQSKLFSRRNFNRTCLSFTTFTIAIALNGCGTQKADNYEATATAKMTWVVEYSNDPLEDKRPRIEEFESVTLVNRNGEKPDGAVFQDDKGIWWPKEPPKPSLDEIEAKQKRPSDVIGKPRRLREVKYRVKFYKDGERLNVTTNHAVYRQVAKAYPDTPLIFTMGINNGSVTKATPQ